MGNIWYLLNPLSLLLGLAAWALPLMAMSRRLRLGKALAALAVLLHRHCRKKAALRGGTDGAPPPPV